MANTQRVQITIAFQYLNATGKLIPAPVGTAVTVTDRNTLSAATVYTAATGGTTIVSPITDANGYVGNGTLTGWVIEGSYTITCAAVPGATPAYPGASVGWEAVRGDGVESIYPGTVTMTHISPLLQQSFLPTGTVIDFPGTIPTGFVLCDGTSYPTTGVTASLFNVIGYAFGGAGPSFNVPDCRGRTLIGPGAGRTQGSVGGEEAHANTTDEVPIHGHDVYDPQHTHGVYDPGHQHYISSSTGGVSSNHYHLPSQDSGLFVGWYLDYLNNGWAGQGLTMLQYGATSGGEIIFIHASTNWAAQDHAHSWGNYTDNRGSGIGIYGAYTGVSLYNAGSNTPHTIMQPWVAHNKIIKL